MWVNPTPECLRTEKVWFTVLHAAADAFDTVGGPEGTQIWKACQITSFLRADNMVCKLPGYFKAKTGVFTVRTTETIMSSGKAAREEQLADSNKC